MRWAALLVLIVAACGVRTSLGEGRVGQTPTDAGLGLDVGADAAPNPCPPAAVPTELYAFPSGGMAIALAQDATYLYAFRNTPKTVVGDLIRVPKCGGAETKLASSIPVPSAIDVDATRVYWVDRNTVAKVRAMPKTGGLVTVVADVGSVPVPMLALRGSRLYYQASKNGTDVFVHELELANAGDGGGSERTIGPSYGFFAVDDARVYTRSKSLWLVAIPTAGGDAIDLAVAPTGGRIAVDGANVYFAENRGIKQGELWVTGLGTPAKRLRQKLDVPSGLAIDATHVYVTEAGFAVDTGVVSRSSRSGDGVEVLASDQAQPELLVVDASSLYWLNYRGAIMKLDKPK